jgi:hypothetical protein
MQSLTDLSPVVEFGHSIKEEISGFFGNVAHRVCAVPDQLLETPGQFLQTLFYRLRIRTANIFFSL